MKSSGKHLFLEKESQKCPENPFKRISFIYMHISGSQLIKKTLQNFRFYQSFDSAD